MFGVSPPWKSGLSPSAVKAELIYQGVIFHMSMPLRVNHHQKLQ